MRASKWGGEEYARQKLEAILLGRDVGLALLVFFFGLAFEVGHGVLQHFHKLQLEIAHTRTIAHAHTSAHAHINPNKVSDVLGHG
jgi:hypothetical protein